MRPMRLDHSNAKYLLVHPPSNDRRHVLTPDCSSVFADERLSFRWLREFRRLRERELIIDLDVE
jgi:hypothetical protein